jgi:hypothetical protein
MKWIQQLLAELFYDPWSHCTFSEITNISSINYTFQVSKVLCEGFMYLKRKEVECGDQHWVFFVSKKLHHNEIGGPYKNLMALG